MQRLVPHGLRAEPAGLVVMAMNQRTGGGPYSVKIPWEWLLDDSVTDAMDRVVRRRLIQIWSEEDLADPLF